METFAVLNKTYVALILSTMLVSLCLLIFSIFLKGYRIRWNWRHTVTTIYCVTLFFNIVVLLTIKRGYYFSSAFLAWYTNLPWYTFMVWSVLMIIFALYVLYREYRYWKYSFHAESIREAINNLPTGLCFSDLDGRLLLCNRSMHSYALEITNNIIMNMNDFWNELLRMEENDNTRILLKHTNIKNGIITVSLGDDRVIRLTQEDIVIEGVKYKQTTILDVSKLHELYKIAEEENNSLRKQRKEIRKLSDELIKSNHSEEVLKHKITIHNEMGQMILSSRQLLENNSDIESYKKSAEEWIILSEKLSNSSTRNSANAEKMLEEIITTASQIGCSVTIGKEVPEKVISQPKIRQAIREAIINAVRHGQANAIDIGYIESQKLLYISNDGDLPVGDIVYSGGLKNLSDVLLVSGGKIEIDTENKFTLNIYLPEDLEL